MCKSIFGACIFFLITMTGTLGGKCPIKCSCRHSSQREDWIKVNCGDLEKIRNFDELDFSNITNLIGQLNLSHNHITVFTPKTQFLALQKLDLSKNQLTLLQNSQFIKLPNLRRLDISENAIKHIEKSAFNGLKNLERLKLSSNQISTIEKGTFDLLPLLKQLDISNNPLKCDCELLWLLEWAAKSSVKLSANPKCSQPPSFREKLLKKIKVGIDIHCVSPAGSRDISNVHLIPNHNQVVFEGDALKMHCKVPSMIINFDLQETQIRDYITWSWFDKNVKLKFEDLKIENKFLAESGYMESTLNILNLNRNHAGIWSCSVKTIHGDHSKSIRLVVISDNTQYCPITTTTDNKGTYTWPRSIVNYTVSLPCQQSIQLSIDESLHRASYFCSESGDWKNLNTSNCSYVSETTKTLKLFSQMNLTLTKDSILETAKRFRNITSDMKILKDTMDLVYVVRTIENYLKYLNIERDLGPILMDISNQLLELPKEYLLAANYVDNTCSKIVYLLEKIASVITPSSSLQKSNVALEVFNINQETFVGKTCTWYVHPLTNKDRFLHCNITSHTSLPQDKAIEASVKIPTSLFYQLHDQGVLLMENSYTLIVSMFSNSKLFPYKDEKKGILSAVVGVNLANIMVTDLQEPVFIMIHIPSNNMYSSIPPTPVWWNPSSNNGTGSWITEGCEYSHELEDNMIFSCKHFGHYGLLQNIEYLNVEPEGAKFRFSHSSIYIGSFVLFLCLLSTSLTYLLCYMDIQMPKKTKHSLINTWLAISLLCFIYVFGIYQTESPELCQIVGLILHYLTLSSLLWMCVSVNIMYKRLTKNNNIVELQDDELPSEEPVRKPILGLYLVGWGIALIVCGISGAVDMKEYSSHMYCFLKVGPALSALFIPFTILLIFLCIFFLLIRCSVYSTDNNGHLSEGTQATENVDLDLLEPNFPNIEVNSIRSVSSKTGSSEIEDSEHSPIAQLKAYIIFLVIYLLAWFSCALATVQPFNFLPLEEEIFSVAYAVFASTLGIFTVFFYCIARNDVRTQWVVMTRCLKKKSIVFRSRTVSDIAQNSPQIQIQSAALPTVINQNAEIQVTSRSSSRSSNKTKTNSNASNVHKAAIDLNLSNASDSNSNKINNVNLLHLHRQQYVIPNLIENPTNCAEMFYNPHQSTVARKFFKRQKRHMMKKNNIARRQVDLNSDNYSVVSDPKNPRDNSSLEQNIFGTNTKVNNTNIHVEKIRKNKKCNPNIFSDSLENVNYIDNVPVKNLIKPTDRVNKRFEINKSKIKKKQNASNKSSLCEANMQSVSQQCTLEYSSETISDSILDKTSPDKYINENEFLNQTCIPMEVQCVSDKRKSYCSQHCVMDFDDKEKYLTKTNNYLKKSDRELNSSYDLSVSSLVVMDSISECRNPNIYVNPSHDLFFNKQVQNRESSVSTSELDELYQQIRRGPKSKFSQSHKQVNEIRSYKNSSSPCLSDSEINSYIGDIKFRSRKKRFGNSTDRETAL